MKFVMLVEGKTERDSAAGFIKRWLDPRLRQPVGIQVVSFDGYADLTRKIQTKAKMHLEGPRRTEIIAVIGLLDLYGPDFYPDSTTSVAERYAWGKAHFEKTIVGLENFRMFFAVHEFEAWLLSQPQIFRREVKSVLEKDARAPEAINFSEPPAKLLDRIYRKQTRRNYKKTTHGKELFPKLDPVIAAAKCPYLKEMLDEMLSLAKKAGLGAP